MVIQTSGVSGRPCAGDYCGRAHRAAAGGAVVRTAGVIAGMPGLISAPWPFLGLPQHETAVQRGSGAPRPSAAVSATDLASLVAIVSLLRARVRRVQRGIVFVVSLARPPFRRPRLARGSSCSSKSARWATAKLGQPPRTTTTDSPPAKFQRCTTCTSEAMLRHVLNIAPGATALPTAQRGNIPVPAPRTRREPCDDGRSCRL